MKKKKLKIKYCNELDLDVLDIAFFESLLNQIKTFKSQ